MLRGEKSFSILKGKNIFLGELSRWSVATYFLKVE